jgi:hypothetical protein
MEEKELAAGNVIQHPEGSLRWNAQLLLMRGDTPSIQQIADRLDGKPAQESSVSINDVRDNMTDAELREFIASAIAGTNAGGNGAAEPDDQVVTHRMVSVLWELQGCITLIEVLRLLLLSALALDRCGLA